jgi:hypothetical protein
MTTKLDTPYTTRHRHRVAAGQVRLQAPWDWMGVQMAMQLAAAAYRIASYQTRHVQAQDVAAAALRGDLDEVGTEHLSMQRMRELFAQHLTEAFSDLAFGAAVERGGCWPGSDYPRVASAMLDQVPPDWRPQYPQFGHPEPGKAATDQELRP